MKGIIKLHNWFPISGAIWWLACLCGSVVSVAAADYPTVDSTAGAYVAGQFVGGIPKGAKISIVFNKDLLIRRNDYNEYLTIPIDDEGRFDVRLPRAENGIGSMTLSMYNDMGVQWNELPYYVEDDDSIFLSLAPDARRGYRIYFSGNDVVKYLAVESMSRLLEYDILAEPFYKSYRKEDRDRLQIDNLIRQTQVTQSVFAEALQYYQSALSQHVYRLVVADVMAKIQLNMLEKYRLWKLTDDNVLVQYLQKNDPLASLDAESLPFSDIYVQYCLKRGISILSSRSVSKSYSVSDMYEFIKQEYTGLLRERLWATYLDNRIWRLGELSGRYQEMDQCLEDALQNVGVENRKLRVQLQQLVDRYQIGALAADFCLPDTTGKMVKLSDFKGKVVLLDLYSNGCTACAVFAKTLKEQGVYEAFQHNNDVAFVSISLQEDRAKWLKYLNRYSSPTHTVCLYTDGKGKDHPYVKSLGIQAVPNLFLIDREGRIFNSSQQTLRASISGADLIEMINKALEEHF